MVFFFFLFTQLYSDVYGMMMPCCHAVCNHPNKDDQSLFDPMHISEGPYKFFKSKQMRQLRLDMMKINPYTPLVNDVCRNCIKEESDGLPSSRIQYEGKTFGRVLDVKLRIFGRKCNLQCFMCNLKNSSGRVEQAHKMVEYNPKVSEFLDYENQLQGGYDLSVDNPEAFDEQLKGLQALASRIKSINIIGGEPFVMPSHYALLDALIQCGEAKNIELSYTSNMTMLQWSNHHIYDYISKFGGCNMMWSVEGVGKYNDYMRFPSNWNTIQKNIEELRPYTKWFGASVTLSALSVLRLDELVGWCSSKDIIIDYNIVEDPEVCRIDALHPNIRKNLSDKYRFTKLEFLCRELDKEVEDWERKWSDFKEYIDAVDYANRTNYREVFPELDESIL